MKLFGKDVSREDLLKRVGDISQVGGARLVEFSEGMGRGMQAVQFRTGSGLDFTVLPGRCMDISLASYRGVPLAWRSATGEISSAHHEPEGLGWLRGFYGGLLVTCGLTYYGAPCEDEGEALGLHGRSSYLAADRVSVGGEWQGEDYIVSVSGRVVQASVFGENVELARKIWARLGEKRFFIEDRITNRGYETTPHMVLYHINLGYPLVDESSRLVAPALKSEPKDEEAAKGEPWNFYVPVKGFKEQCFFHYLAAGSDGMTRAGIVNKDLGLGFYEKYRLDDLPRLTEWKMMGEGTYVVGVEPGNGDVAGRAQARKDGTLRFLEPGEERCYKLELGVMDSTGEIRAFEKECEALKAAG